jgi:hypothetical protein
MPSENEDPQLFFGEETATGKESTECNNNYGTPPSEEATNKDSPSSVPDNKNHEEEMVADAMTLDVAYKSLETIRKVNLQVEFGREIEETECVLSIRQARDQPQLYKNIAAGRLGRLRQMVTEKTASKALPCLTCGTPVCKNHRSADFSKQNITVCNDCAHLFSVEYLMKNIVHVQKDSPEIRKKKMNHMLEVRTSNAGNQIRKRRIDFSNALRFCLDLGLRPRTFNSNLFHSIH